jgi:hypothetical protein
MPVKISIASIIANFILVLVSLLVTLVIVEITLPFFKIRTIEEAVFQARRPVVQAIYGEYNPVVGFTLQKNLRDVCIYYPGQLDYTISTNSRGFRGNEWDLSPARKNVIVLGDSFAFGWGVQWQDTAGQIIERELRKKDPSFQVINLAIPGYSITEVSAVMELYHPILRPAAIVYLFCPNDIDGMKPPVSPGVYDISYHPGPGDEAAFKAMVRRNQPDYWSLKKAVARSYLKAFHARIIRPFFSRRIKDSMRVDPPPSGYDFLPPLAAVERPPDSEESRFIDYCLTRILKTADGAPLYLTTTSDKSILYKKDSAENLRWQLSLFAKRHTGSYFVDYESAVRSARNGRIYYLDYDDHWSKEGHALVAGLLLKSMEKSLPGYRSAGS